MLDERQRGCRFPSSLRSAPNGHGPVYVCAYTGRDPRLPKLQHWTIGRLSSTPFLVVCGVLLRALKGRIVRFLLVIGHWAGASCRSSVQVNCWTRSQTHLREVVSERRMCLKSLNGAQRLNGHRKAMVAFVITCVGASPELGSGKAGQGLESVRRQTKTNNTTEQRTCPAGLDTLFAKHAL